MRGTAESSVARRRRSLSRTSGKENHTAGGGDEGGGGLAPYGGLDPGDADAFETKDGGAHASWSTISFT